MGVTHRKFYENHREPLSDASLQSWEVLIAEYRQELLDHIYANYQSEQMHLAHVEDGTTHTYALCKIEEENKEGFELWPTNMVPYGSERRLIRRIWKTDVPAEEQRFQCCGTFSFCTTAGMPENVKDACAKIPRDDFVKYLQRRQEVLATNSIAQYRQFIVSLKGTYTLSYELHVAPIDDNVE